MCPVFIFTFSLSLSDVLYILSTDLIHFADSGVEIHINKLLFANEVCHMISKFTALLAISVFANCALGQTPGSLYNWEASDPGGNPAQWQSNATNTEAWNLPGGDPGSATAPVLNSITSGKTILTEAYTFNGTNSSAEITGNSTFSNGTGDMTWEFWVRPTDLSGQEVLWDGGGNTDGSSFYFDDNMVRFRAKDSGNQANVAGDLTPFFDTNAPDFLQIVGTFDTSTETIELFIDGVSQGTDTAGGNLGTIIGNDDNGLGFDQGQTGGNPGGAFNNSGFAGDISIFRFSDELLSDDIILENFEALQAAVTPVPEPASVAIWSLLGLGLMGYVYRKRHQ